MSPRDARGNLPLFLSHTPRERDEFVRALGITDYDDINLLNLLCSHAAKRATVRVRVPDLLAEVSAWARAHGKPNLMGGAAKGSLRRLLEALERNGYAKRDDQDTIVLRDGERRAGQGERAVAEIEAILRKMDDDPLQPYPSSTLVKIPSTTVPEVKHTEFTSELVAGHSVAGILRITFSDDLDIVVTTAALPRLLETARLRVHYYIQNNANLRNFVLFELRKIPQFRHIMDQQRLLGYLENRVETSPLFWVYLGLAVARSRDEDLLEPKLRPGRVSLLESAYLLHGYWQHEHHLEQQRKQREEDRAAVIGWVERSGRGFTIDELTDIRDEAGKPLREKYDDAHGMVEELIEAQRAQAEAAGRVPPIVHFGGLWMHHRAVIPSLQEEIRAAADLCRRIVEAEWKTALEQGSTTEPAMNDDAAFAGVLNGMVASRCSALSEMLKKPRLVHLVITEAAETDPALFRLHGALFVGLDDPVFKPMDRLLGLDREHIISHIVSGLSLFRRFLLRRRFRLRKPEARPRTEPARSDGARRSAGHHPEGVVESASLPLASAATVKVTRPRKGKPDTVVLERPSRRKQEPKTMEEAVDKLKEAMTKRRTG